MSDVLKTEIYCAKGEIIIYGYGRPVFGAACLKGLGDHYIVYLINGVIDDWTHNVGEWYDCSKPKDI